MERETKTIKTSGDHEVVIYSSLTYGESRKISSVFLDGMNVSMEEGQAKIPEMNAGLSIQAQNKAIELLIVSIDGKKENLVEELEALPVADGQEIVKELDSIQNPINEQKKTN
jgi:hypothetical protein